MSSLLNVPNWNYININRNPYNNLVLISSDIPEKYRSIYKELNILYDVNGENLNVRKSKLQDKMRVFSDYLRDNKDWFHPTVDVQRNEKSDLYAFDGKSKYDIIQPGDLVHCDFGISYLTLNTDCQQIAYVLKDDENEAPDFLVNALKDANKLQDILTGEFELNKTGNEILFNSLKIAKQSGLDPQIYTHPLGTFGHSAGTTIGMRDSQNGVPVKGDVSMNYDTVYAIELNNKSFIKEWNKEVRIMLEEAGLFEKNGFRYINGRQTEILLIKPFK